MKLNEIYLSEEATRKLFEKLEIYNHSKISEEQITAQELAEKLLEYAIAYLGVGNLD